MKKLIEVRKGDVVPDNATFVSTRTSNEYSHSDYDHGFLWITRTSYYKTITYYVYEVPVESDSST